MSHYDSNTGLIKVSWSKVRVSEECRQKSWLISEGKKSSVADVRIFLPGNVVDQAMRKWLSMDTRPRNWMATHVDEVMDEVEEKIKDGKSGVIRWKSKEDRREVREMCVECAMRLEPILNQLVTPYEFNPALRFETKLSIPGLDGEPTPILLVGEMDVLTKYQPPLPDISSDPDLAVSAFSRPEFRVWDLKVTKDASYWRKTIAQLTFYDIACSCLFGSSAVEVGLIQPMVYSQPWLSFRPSDEDRTQMFTRIVNVAQSIMHKDYAPKDGSSGCGWCECRNACVKYATGPGTNKVNLF